MYILYHCTTAYIHKLNCIARKMIGLAYLDLDPPTTYRYRILDTYKRTWFHLPIKKWEFDQMFMGINGGSNGIYTGLCLQLCVTWGLRGGFLLSFLGPFGLHNWFHVQYLRFRCWVLIGSSTSHTYWQLLDKLLSRQDQKDTGPDYPQTSFGIVWYYSCQIHIWVSPPRMAIEVASWWWTRGFRGMPLDLLHDTKCPHPYLDVRSSHRSIIPQ